MVTQPNPANLDERGVERTRKDEPGMIDKYRDKWQWFDHIMRMQERYTEHGGNQYAAGITYFSVLSLFPLLMLTFAILAMVLAGNQDLMDKVTTSITDSAGGEMGETLKTVIEDAVAQRKSVFSVALLLALWTGLSWVAHLRMGASEMWKVNGLADNFIVGKLKDLVVLIGLIFALIVAFAITTVGNSGITDRLIEMVGLDGVPGIRFLTFAAALVIGVIANWLVFAWMIGALPRAKTHRKSVAKAAIIGAVLFEVFKQFATLFFSNALSNPAAATFGPIIGIMVTMYLIWRILLYCSAWAATTPESLAELRPEAPPAAIIRVRQEVRTGSSDAGRAGLVGTGAALGVLVGGAVASMFRR
ncbi:YhjD/YihY/BrkB family envelope integrity protein [Corynebacterium suicordis]|uniref:YihY/virulence factor BrkB family protein n=1 Tax=Corynebacterium suicordis DSM 45110 TaxID=1121369 RepID=A0ABR9ZHR7_9CORY|nr:YhjD/YihY/BrkB family envelope integrity protein [Corynebacterium suicordis]MBF4552980.1 YihY/virulence factor BrkB family protein [Corynebacterium suicordis DSM 45110]MDR6278058.1 membrane protein [Corynebacterium suicordis]